MKRTGNWKRTRSSFSNLIAAGRVFFISFMAEGRDHAQLEASNVRNFDRKRRAFETKFRFREPRPFFFFKLENSKLLSRCPARSIALFDTSIERNKAVTSSIISKLTGNSLELIKSKKKGKLHLSIFRSAIFEQKKFKWFSGDCSGLFPGL